MQANDRERACALFSESYRLDPAIGTLYNQAVCEEEVGRLATAWTAFRKVVDVAPPADDRAVAAKHRLAELEPRLPRLRIRLAASLSPTLSIRLDGVTISPVALGEPLPVDPGEHTLSLVRGATVLRMERLSVRAGESMVHEVQPWVDVAQPRHEPSAGPATAERKPDLTTAHSRSMASGGYTALGLGGLALGTSAVLGLRAIRERNLMRSHCRDATCDPTGEAAANRGDRYSTLASAGLAVGIVGVTTGVVLLWNSKTISVLLAVDTGGISLEGGF
jgi:hypothetical protein